MIWHRCSPNGIEEWRLVTIVASINVIPTVVALSITGLQYRKNRELDRHFTMVFIVAACTSTDVIFLLQYYISNFFHDFHMDFKLNWRIHMQHYLYQPQYSLNLY